MTETLTCTLTPVNTMAKGSCGMTLPSVKLKVVDIDTGTSLGPNKTGEICVAGPNVSGAKKSHVPIQVSVHALSRKGSFASTSYWRSNFKYNLTDCTSTGWRLKRNTIKFDA